MSHMQTYDVHTDTWILQSTVLQTPRLAAGAAVINNKLYIVGGGDFRLQDSSPEVFCIEDDGTCSYSAEYRLPRLKHQRRFHSVVPRNDEIYVIGGYDDDGGDMKVVEVINTSEYHRYDIEPMHDCRSFLSGVLYEDSIIVTGGHGSQGKLSSVETYSFKAKSWTYLPSMKVAREGHCSCVFDGCIYVVGGRNTNSIEIYNGVTKSWLLLETTWKIERCWSTLVQVLCEKNTEKSSIEDRVT